MAMASTQSHFPFKVGWTADTDGPKKRCSTQHVSTFIDVYSLQYHFKIFKKCFGSNTAGLGKFAESSLLHLWDSVLAGLDDV